MPMTGFADVAAGFPSLVMRVIGTSIAIVLMLEPLKRLIAERVDVVGVLVRARLSSGR